MISSARRAWIWFALTIWLLPYALLAEEPAPVQDTVPPAKSLHEYKSRRLHVWTDLPVPAADALCARLEETLDFAARYWGSEPRGQIQCYVVDDLQAWTDAQLPDRLARVIVSGIGGATLSERQGTGARSRIQPTVYASSTPGVAEHEITHAYCIQTFGSSGPDWYKEGMAEMAVRGCTLQSGLRCSHEQIATLRDGRQSTLPEIFGMGQTGQQIGATLQALRNDPVHRGRHIPSATWTQQDADNVAQARDENLRSWALCYMLLHNPNYAKRFRHLGGVYVASQREAFDEFFAPMRGEIEFEYRFLLEHLTTGFRVDLCHWDWGKRFQPLPVGDSHATQVVAARGYQASGLTVSTGQRYAFQTTGSWSTSGSHDGTDADGNLERAGGLVGVVLNEWSLSEVFPLGVKGDFYAPSDGQLFLRCEDAWSELGDNHGQVSVKFKRL